VGRVINLLLADEFVLYAATRGFHWNVAGTNFAWLRDFFEQQFRQVAEGIEQLVEHSCAIGVWPSGGLSALAKTSRLDSDPGADLPAEDMVAELCGLHAGLAKQVDEDIAICAKRTRDPGVVEFLSRLKFFHEESAGRLHAVLVNGIEASGAGAEPVAAAGS
jgi:starvation-inducible DNA-binding protein